MKYYLSLEEFRDKIINLPDDESLWRMKCENEEGRIYTLTFSKHRFEAEDGNTYPFVVYSFPMTLDAGIINERIDEGWDEDIEEVWNDIVSSCGFKPFVSKRMEPQDDMEFFSIEPDGHGGKQIHIFGYCYMGDDIGEGPWRNVEYTFFIEPLSEFIEHLEKNENYVNDTAANVKQYISDYTEEGITDIINHYFNGHEADGFLHYSELSMDTPCGDYVSL